MRMLVFKRQIVFVIFLMFCSLSIYSVDDSAATEQVTIKLDEPGTLLDNIGEENQYKITGVKIIGSINGADIRCLRNMAGCDVYGEPTCGQLVNLDLEDSKIVASDAPYYINTLWRHNYLTKDNELGDYCFQGCKLVNVVLPNNISSIGFRAFAKCESLKEIILPSSLKTLGGYSFFSCIRLKKIQLPEKITLIEDAAFQECKSLESMVIPNNVTNISASTFYGCLSLLNVNLPSNITSIDRSAFWGCTSLEEIILPSHLTNIGDCAFGFCKSLKTLHLPNGVGAIGEGAFEYCKNLQSLTIPSGVDEIKSQTFSNCSKLGQLILPSNLSWIDEYAFACSGLEKISLPSSVTFIANNAFDACLELTSLYVNWLTPLKINESLFKQINKKKCILYVPKGTALLYKNEIGWSSFETIVEHDVTGIDNTTISSDAKEVSRYSVNGQRLSAPAKGLNIVKYSDGSVKKVAVQ